MIHIILFSGIPFSNQDLFVSISRSPMDNSEGL